MLSTSNLRRALLFFFFASAQLSCVRRENPRVTYERARATFVYGDLIGSQRQAEEGYERFRSSNDEWAWKFKLLEAESMLWRGMYQDVLALLNVQPSEQSAKIQMLALRGAAQARLGEFPEAEKSLNEASRLCAESADASCGAVSRAQGVLATERRQLAQAEQAFKQSLTFARAHQDRLLEATALLNLGAVALLDERFDEAATSSSSAYQLSLSLNAQDIAQNSLGNIGWAYYRLGDNERALDLFLEARNRAAELGDLSDEASWLTDAGHIYIDIHQPELARQSFQRALDLERQVQSKEDIYNALRVLARLSLETGDLVNSGDYASQALEIARQSGNHVDELYPLLVEGQIAARRGEFKNAETIFRQVEDDKICPVFLKWEAQHSLARLYENHQPAAADREYRAALSTFEAARANVRHEDFQLSFLTNAAAIYDDYISFLVAQGKIEGALRWADYSRARTLSEGLGLLPRESTSATTKSIWINPPALNPREIATRSKGAVLYYWLGEKQSYLWVITTQKTSLFPLRPAAEINSMVDRYRKELIGPRDVLDAADGDGSALFRTLIAPANQLLPRDAKVFIVADGSLNSLNFETLVVANPNSADRTPHYWIEDADIVNASSLRLLAASFAPERSRDRKLLLIGDSVPPNNDYPALPQAAGEMANVARYFPASDQKIYARGQATPTAYLASNPEQFSYIHFVAHGTASRLSPLDSAIVLSRNADNPDSFKLYAREIMKHPLHAELVTISACYGAGQRAYSGEGLVGLAWAFLRTGAHYVVAALWEVTDASTIDFMDRFYRELQQGRSPDVALRDAKLSLIHSQGVFRKPFYWAPFQLYTGRESPSPK